MNFKKNLQLSNLFEFYGKLLTPHQQNIFTEYYFNNMSLGEIAENFNISRQAVLDSLQKSEKQLNYFENILLISKKYHSLKKLVTELDEQKNSQIISKLKDVLSEWEE